eukprot:TRINITY_DN7520_c0_g1_i1.p1 TRINITY_DN7520_c0_g1~~TRINITY_DN7520_c0_g1_i1.p1  ORF type:complete len:346 (+),score=95.85 TRINITY_DN7520_c0_g1_i1:32-1069(+)
MLSNFLVRSNTKVTGKANSLQHLKSIHSHSALSNIVSNGKSRQTKRKALFSKVVKRSNESEVSRISIEEYNADQVDEDDEFYEDFFRFYKKYYGTSEEEGSDMRDERVAAMASNPFLERWDDDAEHSKTLPDWKVVGRPDLRYHKKMWEETKEEQDSYLKYIGAKIIAYKKERDSKRFTNFLKMEKLRAKWHERGILDKKWKDPSTRRLKRIEREEQLKKDPNYFHYPEINWFVLKEDLRQEEVRNAVPLVLNNKSMSPEEKRRLLDKIIHNLKRAATVTDEDADYLDELYESVKIPAHALTGRTELEKDSQHGLRLPYKHSEVFEALERELDPEVVRGKYNEKD